MARLVKQFRYYGPNHSKNYPEQVNYSSLAAGNIFANYNPVTQLGIQAEPGVKFYVNYSTDPIMIGDTGIFELDLEGLGTITSIRFDRNDLEAVKDTGPILIDIIYEGGGAQ